MVITYLIHVILTTSNGTSLIEYSWIQSASGRATVGSLSRLQHMVLAPGSGLEILSRALRAPTARPEYSIMTDPHKARDAPNFMRDATPLCHKPRMASGLK